MSEQLRIILIIIVSVSIFGLVVFVLVKNYIKNKIQYYLEELYDTTGQINMREKVCDQAASHHREVLKLVSTNNIPALLIISEVFLFLTFVLHAIVPEFRKQMSGWMKMCTIASLFIAFKVLIIEDYNILCQFLGFLYQYFLLSTFCWMYAMSPTTELTRVRSRLCL